MGSLSEVRKVRTAMSAAVGHEVRKLIAQRNAGREDVRARIIAPGALAETCGSPDGAHDGKVVAEDVANDRNIPTFVAARRPPSPPQGILTWPNSN